MSLYGTLLHGEHNSSLNPQASSAGEGRPPAPHFFDLHQKAGALVR
jgi:hypothetical protein